jgi:DNA (cytosine-5)-methyltransferase 1
MKYMSLFSGVGGFELGIGDRGECVGYSEIDKYAIQVYNKHFPTHTNYGDITKINAEELPDFDLLVGGFPCQAFSIAGKRRGFADTRGTLFFDIARILKVKRPGVLLLENVKGLLSHDDGNTFKTIISTLTELGYDIQWQVCNSKNHGVPQNRERVFIVGHLRGTPRPEIFPLGKSSSAHLEEITRGVSDAQRIYNPRGLGKSQKALGGGLGAKTGLYAIPEATKKGYTIARSGDSINISVPTSKTRRGRVGGGYSKHH